MGCAAARAVLHCLRALTAREKRARRAPARRLNMKPVGSVFDHAAFTKNRDRVKAYKLMQTNAYNTLSRTIRRRPQTTEVAITARARWLSQAQGWSLAKTRSGRSGVEIQSAGFRRHLRHTGADVPLGCLGSGTWGHASYRQPDHARSPTQCARERRRRESPRQRPAGAMLTSSLVRPRCFSRREHPSPAWVGAGEPVLQSLSAEQDAGVAGVG